LHPLRDDPGPRRRPTDAARGHASSALRTFAACLSGLDDARERWRRCRAAVHRRACRRSQGPARRDPNVARYRQNRADSACHLGCLRAGVGALRNESAGDRASGPTWRRWRPRDDHW
jgi:hypothetical protein